MKKKNESSNITIIISADLYASRELIRQSVDVCGLVYLRCAKSRMPIIYSEQEEFVIGKAKQLKEGDEVAVIASGAVVYLALKAAEELENEGISVKLLDMHTIYPIDRKAVQECLKIGKIVIVEDLEIPCNMGTVVGDFVVGQRQGKLKRIGIRTQSLLNQNREECNESALKIIVKSAEEMLY